MEHQYIKNTSNYRKYEAELLNPEGEVICKTNVLQKLRDSSDMMVDEVGLAHNVTASNRDAEVHQTWCSRIYDDRYYKFFVSVKGTTAIYTMIDEYILSLCSN